MDKERRALVLILLVFYCLPWWIVLIIATKQLNSSASGTIEAGAFLEIIVKLAKEPGAYTNIIHQMILPAVAAITASSPETASFRTGWSWIFIIPLVTVAVCITNAILFNTQYAGIPAGDNGVVSQFFIGIASNLSIYVMLLVGLRSSNSSVDADPKKGE